MDNLPRNFHHPYKPYDIQFQLMSAIYDCIADGKIGIFESPTGTGKSLSLICSSLTWLRDNQEANLQKRLDADAQDDEPTWVVEYTQKEKMNALVEQKLQFEARLRKIRAKELQTKQRYENGKPNAKRIKTDETGETSEVDNEAQFELGEYNSEDENVITESTVSASLTQGLSSTSLQLMDRLGLTSNPSAEKEELVPTDELKIFFCSRTHSQLTQFVQEVRRVELPGPSWEKDKDGSEEVSVVKHVPLGSRKNLCINSNVARLGSVTAINERCLDLQQPGIPKVDKCPFLPNKENETLVNDFRDYTLAKVRDIEDLGSLGKKIGICPYYASRAAIKPSQIVTLPYPLLLQRSAREALGISLKGHIVVIDEAHNLMDTISNIHSICVTLRELKLCRAQLGTYLQKFRNRLKGKNRVYVTQVVRLIDSIAAYLQTVGSGNKSVEGIVNVSDLMAGKGVDQINLYKLMHYIQESKLARKVEGYAQHAKQQELKGKSRTDTNLHTSTMPVLTHIQSLLHTLSNPAAEGRFFYERDENKDIGLKYMLLDPTHHFKEIVEEARAVILAGGTMSPMDDYIRHLFAYVDPNRLQTFSCGHIIPKENLIALPVAKGNGGVDFDFTYEKRNSLTIIDALGYSLIEFGGSIPDGLVVFFPSYVYLDQVILRWQIKSKDGSKSCWERLLDTKPIFRESKTTTGTDDIFTQYAQAISAGKGGLLLSVIGGKLSEGINFSDALGRGVIVVGLPFPNIQSAQWKAKIEYVEKTTFERGGSREEGKALAREFYENACMRAVNQSIGRAVRHKADYACILLLDRRYDSPRIEGKLPAWIRQGMGDKSARGDFRETVVKVKAFFKDRA